ncbi:MAG: hypothetical protein GKR87_04280 [Kiritimatiellae bacterium]|nr:hypothetical protein [Kiritimatiellia bacterium]
MYSEDTAQSWEAAALASEWAIGQLTDQTVSFKWENKKLEYRQLPDGTFSPPPGVTTELTSSNGLYQLKEQFGTVLEFGANQKINNWKDIDGNTLTFSYNAQTNLDLVTDTYNRSLAFTYNPNGTRLDAVTDSTGRSINYQYNAQGDLTTYTDPENNSWEYTYNNDHRFITSIDPLNQTGISNIYGVTGQVVTQHNASGDVYTFYYTDFRNVEENPQGNQRIHYFDKKHRQYAIENELGNLQLYIHDGQDHIILELDSRSGITRRYYDSYHNPTNTRNALGNETHFIYDTQHCLIRVRDSLGNETDYGYDTKHHLTSQTNASGHVTTRSYYPDGLLKTEQQTVNGEQRTVNYIYDNYRQPQAITRTHGGTQTNTWNARGNLLQSTDANGNSTTYIYDRNDHAMTITDAKGNMTSNTYNQAGQLVATKDRNQNSTTRTYTPTYKIGTITHPDGSVISNQYDSRDLLIAITDGQGNTASNEYDEAQRLVKIIDPLGHAKPPSPMTRMTT